LRQVSLRNPLIWALCNTQQPMNQEFPQRAKFHVTRNVLAVQVRNLNVATALLNYFRVKVDEVPYITIACQRLQSGSPSREVGHRI
jgi:hypothetical protein